MADRRIAWTQADVDAGIGQAAPGGPSGTALVPWNVGETPGTTGAQSWFGGRNVWSTENGWDNDFQDRAQAQHNEWLAKSKGSETQNADPAAYFRRFDADNPTATGVALWDDPNGKYKAGEVFDNGKRLGNLYDNYSADDAALMIAPLLFDGGNQRELFDEGKLTEAVSLKLQEGTEWAQNSITAGEYESQVREREESLAPWSGLGSFAAGAGGGAAAGASALAIAGSIVPGLGTVAGAIVGGIGGAIVGGIGGWLNRDQFTEQVSRSIEQAETAYEQGNWLNATGATLEGAGQLMALSSKPLSNLYQGGFDAVNGELGDSTAEFYELDEDGNRKAGAITQALDLVATVGDSILSFGSAPARAAYMTQMGTTVTGGVVSLGDGAVWNPGKGQYDELEGAGEWAAAVGSVGIDAAQMGVARGMARSAAFMRSRSATEGAEQPLVRDLIEGKKKDGLLQRWSGTSTEATKLERALDKASFERAGKMDDYAKVDFNRSETLNGLRFFRDAEGNVIHQRMTAQLLVPSEFTKWLPTGFIARSAMGASRGLPSADDVYAAAKKVARSGNMWRDGLMNAYGEASEEAVQTFLDPIAYGEMAGGDEIAHAAAMGAAAGMGMSIGAQIGTNRQLAKLGEMLDMDFAEQETLDQIRKSAAGLHEYEEASESPLGRDAAQRLVEVGSEAAYKNSGSGLDGAVVLLPMSPNKLIIKNAAGQEMWEEAEYAPDAAVMSGFRLNEFMKQKPESFIKMKEDMSTRIKRAEKALQDATPGSPEAELAAQQLAAYQAELADMDDLVEVSSMIAKHVNELYQRYVETGDIQVLEELDLRLQGGALGRWEITTPDGKQITLKNTEAVRRTVEMAFARHPFQGTASRSLLVPRISMMMSTQGNDGSVHAHQALLLNPNADFDGDFKVRLNTVYMNPGDRKATRMGSAYLSDANQTGDKLSVLDSQTGEKTARVGIPPHDEVFALKIRDWSNQPGTEYSTNVSNQIVWFRDWFLLRYGRPFAGNPGLTPILDAFEADLRSGSADARQHLLDAMINLDLDTFLNIEPYTPEIPLLSNQVSLLFERMSQEAGKIRYAEEVKQQRGKAPRPRGPVGVQNAEKFVRGKAVKDAQNYGVMSASLLSPDPMRAGQMVNYLMELQAATIQEDFDTSTTVTAPILEMAERYMLLQSGDVLSSTETLEALGGVQQRVRDWLRQEAIAWMNQVGRPLEENAIVGTMIMLAQQPMPNVNAYATDRGNAVTVRWDEQITLAQFLLRRSVDIERANRSGEHAESPVMIRLNQIDGFTRPNKKPGERSYTHAQAFAEVFDVMMIEDLLGEESAQVGVGVTLGSLSQMMATSSGDVRDEYRARWAGPAATAYLRSPELGDPPYGMDKLASGQLNPYTVVVNNLLAVGNTAIKARRKSNKTAHENAIQTVAGLRDLVDNSFNEVAKLLRKGDSTVEISRRDVLDYILRTNEQARQAVLKLLPDEALFAAFRRNPDTGEIQQAKWITDSLLEQNAERAVRGLYFNAHVAMFNWMASVAGPEGVKYESLTSRFQQVYWRAIRNRERDGGASMALLELLMFDSDSLDEAFNRINETVSLRGGRAELLPWHDDVADWEKSLGGDFDQKMPSAELRARMAEARASVDQMVSSRDLEIFEKEDRAILAKMKDRLTELGGVLDPDAMKKHRTRSEDQLLLQLEKIIAHAKISIDSTGGAARRSTLLVAMRGVLGMHNKGVSAVGFEPLGDPMAFDQNGALQSGVAMEIDVLTRVSWNNVEANLSRLAKEPVIIQFNDGREVAIDLTTLEGALDALSNPLTTQFARAVLLPTVRDVNANGSSQQYALSWGARDISTALREATFAHLFQGIDTTGPSKRNAYDYVGLVEAMVRAQVQDKPADVRKQAAFRVQSALNEFGVSYTVGPNKRRQSNDALADDLVKNYAQAIMLIQQMPPDVRERLRLSLKMQLAERRKGSGVSDLLSKFQGTEKGAIEEGIKQLALSLVDNAKRRVDEISDQILVLEEELTATNSTLTTTPELQELRDERDMLAEQITKLGTTDSQELVRILDPDRYTEMSAVMRALTYDPSAPKDERDAVRNAIVVSLVEGDEVKHFNREKQPQLISRLYNASEMGEPVDPLAFTDKEMAILSDWAVRAHMTFLAGGVSIHTGIIADPKGTENTLRLFDPTHAFLVDQLFDEQVLEAAGYFAEMADINATNRTYTSRSEVERTLLRTLFSEDLLGDPVPALPSMIAAVHKAVRTAPTSSSLPMHGSNPMNMLDMMAAGWATFTPPPPAATATASFVLDPAGEGVHQQLFTQWKGGAPNYLAELEHQMVTSIRIKSADGSVDGEFIGDIGDRSMFVPAGGELETGYAVLPLSNLQAWINRQIERNPGLGALTIEIDHVDRAQKPQGVTHVNSIYFDGVGREFEGSVGVSAAAALFFAPGALNSIGQQIPLDAVKTGVSLVPHITGSVAKGNEIRTNGTNGRILDTIYELAMEAWTKEYETGYLQQADLPALIKMMTMRHLVGVTGTDGTTRLATVDEAIAMQSAGEVTAWELKPLSREVANTLFGNNSNQGTPGTYAAPPVLNIMDVSPIVDLSPAALKAKGLEYLFDTAELWNTAAGQMAMRSRGPSADVGEEVAPDSTMRLMAVEQASLLATRAQLKNWDGEGFDEQNSRRLANALASSTVLRAAMPGTVLNMAALSGGDTGAQTVAASLKRLKMTDANRILTLVADPSSKIQSGFLTSFDIENDFKPVGDMPTALQGDVVPIELSSFVAKHNGDLEKAGKEVKKAIDTLSRRGVTIFLYAESGDAPVFRSTIVDWLINEANLPLAPVDGSGMQAWEPNTEATRTGRIIAAQASLLTETRVATGQGLTLALLDYAENPFITENAVFYDPEWDPEQRRHSVALLPMQYTEFGPNKTPRSFGIPSSGPRRDAMVRDLAKVLNDPEQFDMLLESLGDDPKGIPIRTLRADGRWDPGVRGNKAALEALRDLVSTGNPDAVFEQRTLIIGDFIPVMDATGNMILTKYGYKSLKTKDLPQRTDTYRPADGRRITISVPNNDLELLLTTPPGEFFVERLIEVGDTIRMVGEVAYDSEMKLVWEGLGFKAGTTTMPNDRRPTNKPLGASGANGIRVTQWAAGADALSKQAVNTVLDNFSDAMFISGWSFKDDLMTYFYGHDMTGPQAEVKWNELLGVLQTISYMNHGMTERELRHLFNTGNMMPAARVLLEEQFAGLAFPPVKGIYAKSKDDRPSSRIAQAVIGTLMLPGVQVHHVLEGIGAVNVPAADLATTAIVRPPTILAQLLSSRTHYPNTFNEMLLRINSQFDNGDGPTFRLNPDWTFDILMTDASGNVKMLSEGQQLAYVTPIAAENNAATYSHKLNLRTSRGASQHTTAVINAGFGGSRVMEPQAKEDAKTQTVFERKASKNLRAWFEPSKMVDYAEVTDFSGLYEQLDLTPEQKAAQEEQDKQRMAPGMVDKYWSGDRYTTELEAQVIRRSRDDHEQFFAPIERSGWSEYGKAEKTILAKNIREIMQTLNLEDIPNPSNLIDAWIRQLYGAPGKGKAQTDYTEHVTYEMYVQGLAWIKENIDNNYLPTHGGAQPLMDAHMLRKLYIANRGKDNGWAPVMIEDVAGGKRKKRIVAKEWGDWMSSAIGQVLDTQTYFDSMYDYALNGAWFTYNAHLGFSEELAITFRPGDAKYLGGEIVSSLLEDQQQAALTAGPGALMADPVILNSVQNRTIDAALGRKEITFKSDLAAGIDASQIAKNADHRAAWKASKKLTKQKNQTFKDYRRQGATYMESSNKANVLMHNLVNVSLINRMLNPGIYIGGFIEMPIRAAFEQLGALLYGDAVGFTGRGAAKLGVSKYTDEDVQKINDLARVLGASTYWKNAMDNELLYNIKPDNVRIGPKSDWLDDLASGVTRFMSNPFYRVRGDVQARHYINAALGHLEMMGEQITIDQFVQRMKADPMWLQNMVGTDGLTAHQAGINKVAQLRVTKPTMASRALRAAPNSLMNSARPSANVAGHLLHLPLMFANFNMNMLTTMTGMSGWDQAAAMFFHGREKPGWLQKGRNGEKWDFSDVVEALDLQQTFVRSGLTLTMIGTAALFLGNLGFDGDDEEAKRRERLARYLRVPDYKDPRALQNQFTYADGVFFDNIPILGDIFKDEVTGRSVVVPHWMIKQFTSPLIGIQRFFDTGQLDELWDGYWDAFSAIPNSMISVWSHADTLATELAETAAAEENPEMANRARADAVTRSIVGIFGVFERMLIENQTINALYQASDEYARNPFVIPRTDEFGNLFRAEGSGVPVAAKTVDEVLFTDPVTGEVEVRQAYMTRSGMDAQLMNYAKNNAVFSFLASLVTGGGDSQFLRSNMVPVEKKIELEKTSDEKAAALLIGMLELDKEKGGIGTEMNLSETEIAQIIRNKYDEQGEYVSAEEVAAEAAEIYADKKAMSDLTILDELGNELLSDAGAKAVFESIQRGSLKIDSPAMRGISMDLEQRKRVGAVILQEVIEDAMELGLTREQAGYVANRFYWGDKTTGKGGLHDLLNNQTIPYSNVQRYNQLNVTFMRGPDGRPWATPFERQNFFGALGIPLPQREVAQSSGLSKDAQGKVIDPTIGEKGINTGLHALERQTEPFEKIELEIDKIAANAKPNNKKGRRGGGGGGSYRAGNLWRDMRPIAGQSTVRDMNVPFINSDNPMIRRARVDRERVFSERGRLKQWQ